jgi:hypothetical protein
MSINVLICRLKITPRVLWFCLVTYHETNCGDDKLDSERIPQHVLSQLQNDIEVTSKYNQNALEFELLLDLVRTLHSKSLKVSNLYFS